MPCRSSASDAVLPDARIEVVVVPAVGGSMSIMSMLADADAADPGCREGRGAGLGDLDLRAAFEVRYLGAACGRRRGKDADRKRGHGEAGKHLGLDGGSDGLHVFVPCV